MTGTYKFREGHWVRVSKEIPKIQCGVYFNKGGVPSFDPSAKRVHQSKADKRAWMKRHGLKEGGIINPDKRLEGSWLNASKPTFEQRKRKKVSQDWIVNQGGTSGLLDRLEKKRNRAHV